MHIHPAVFDAYPQPARGNSTLANDLNFERDKITLMLNEHVERVRSAMLPLCEPLHDTFAWAEQLRRERLPMLDDEPYRWHATHTVRAFAHLRLKSGELDLGGWRLRSNHSQNGPIHLYYRSAQLRVLHALDEYSSCPPPGPNHVRRAYYRNPPLGAALTLFGDPDDQLIALWRIDPATGQPHFRVVRTVGDWKWGEHHRADLEFDLPELGVELSELAFEPTDEELGLFRSEEDEESGEDAGGSAG